MVLTILLSAFMEFMISHVIYHVLLHQKPSHSHALDGGKTHFNQENNVGSIDFNFEVISYKMLLDLLNHSPRFSRDATTSKLHNHIILQSWQHFIIDEIKYYIFGVCLSLLF